MNHQDTVFACIDGLATTHAVVDGAFWAAERLQAPMALLHALERPEPMPPVGDYSGVIGMGAQDMLLERLNTLDEERTHVAQEAARRMLDEAQARVDQTRIPSLQVLLRHGELTDVLLEGTQLLYVGDDDTIQQAFGVTPKDNSVFLPRVMSRKKQIIPMLSALWG